MAKIKNPPRDALDDILEDEYRFNLDISVCRLERDNVPIRPKDIEDIREISKIIWPEGFPEKKHFLIGPNDPIPEECYYTRYHPSMKPEVTQPIRRIDIRPKELREADPEDSNSTALPPIGEEIKKPMSTQRQRDSARANAQ